MNLNVNIHLLALCLGAISAGDSAAAAITAVQGWDVATGVLVTLAAGLTAAATYLQTQSQVVADKALPTEVHPQ